MAIVPRIYGLTRFFKRVKRTTIDAQNRRLQHHHRPVI
jgi:hypothetical protein